MMEVPVFAFFCCDKKQASMQRKNPEVLLSLPVFFSILLKKEKSSEDLEMAKACVHSD